VIKSRHGCKKIITRLNKKRQAMEACLLNNV